jgi:DNA-binding HxlR family transcriptional regulator
MLGKTYDSEVCSISRTLEVFGERWSFLIMRNALFAGATRFGEFQAALGIASNILATRLDHLVAAGVMERTAEENGEYLLTERGRDLLPALVALTEWGDRWSAPHGEPVLYRHAAAEHPVHMQLTCDVCGPLGADEVVHALPGPAMPQDRAERMMARHAAAQQNTAAAGQA